MLKFSIISLTCLLFFSKISYSQVSGLTVEGTNASFDDPATVNQYFLGTIGRNPHPYLSPLPTDWWSLINIRHRNGAVDGHLWGTQIAVGLTYHYDRMFFRSQVAGAWQPWNEVLTTGMPRVLVNKPVDDNTTALQVNGDASAVSFVAKQQTSQYGSRLFSLNNAANQARFAIGYYTPEGGSNTGSNFAIYAYDDGGNYKSTPFAIERATGNVGIGTDITNAKLTVNGAVLAKKVKVTENLSSWPDYVFDKDYPLPSLATVENYIGKHKHLPEIPSATEIEKEGHDIGEMNKKLLKKVEELTLYLIDQQKQLAVQQQQQAVQQAEINYLRSVIEKKK